jgi:ABC-type multidrug transport system ATPase subunit
MAQPETDPVIVTDRVSRRFGQIDAVREVSLTVPAGSICGFIGANGAGKTTTLKLLMNLIRPTSGRATVLGVDSRQLGPRQLAQIGVRLGEPGPARHDDGARAARVPAAVLSNLG